MLQSYTTTTFSALYRIVRGGEQIVIIEEKKPKTVHLSGKLAEIAKLVIEPGIPRVLVAGSRVILFSSRFLQKIGILMLLY